MSCGGKSDQGILTATSAAPQHLLKLSQVDKTVL